MVCYVFVSPRVKTKREFRYDKNGIDFHAMRRFQKKSGPQSNLPVRRSIEKELLLHNDQIYMAAKSTFFGWLIPKDYCSVAEHKETS
jgi:hypothetical protein